MSAPRNLLIPTPLLELLEKEALTAYPEECCGVLLGRLRGQEPLRAEVREVAVAANSATDHRWERYVIDPTFLLGILQEARQRGLDVVGYYHSHPDHGAIPGRFDLESAWPGVGYVIVAVDEDQVTDARCWCLEKDGESFREVSIGYS